MILAIEYSKNQTGSTMDITFTKMQNTHSITKKEVVQNYFLFINTPYECICLYRCKRFISDSPHAPPMRTYFHTSPKAAPRYLYRIQFVRTNAPFAPVPVHERRPS